MQYEIMILYAPSSGHEWYFDSVRNDIIVKIGFHFFLYHPQIVVLPDVTMNSSLYDSLDELDQDMVVMSCLPFSLPTPSNDFCDRKTFQFSLELYEEVFRELICPKH